jgi:hypothetical protein
METAANAIGDTETAQMAREIRAQEENAAQMIQTRLQSLPAKVMQPATT